MNVREVVLSEKLLESQVYVGFSHILAVKSGENGPTFNPAAPYGLSALIPATPFALEGFPPTAAVRLSHRRCSWSWAWKAGIYRPAGRDYT